MNEFDDLLEAAPSAPKRELTPFQKSIVQQESGGTGDYNAVGKVYTHRNTKAPARMDLGEIALGKYQVVPKFWFEKIGLDPLSQEDRDKFLASPGLQDLAHQYVIEDGEKRYPGDYEKQAAAYYGGAGGVSVLGTPEGDVPQSNGAPSVNQYTREVTGRLPQPTEFDDLLEGAPSAPAVATTTTPSDDFSSLLEAAPSVPTAPRPPHPIPPPLAPTDPNFNPLAPTPIPGIPGMGGEKIAPMNLPPDPNQAITWDPRKVAEENRQKAINTAKGAEFMQAQVGASTPMAYPNMTVFPKNEKPEDLTPEAYQRRKMGEPTTPIQFAGDVEKASTDYTTGLLANWLSGKSTMEAAGERMAQTEATITHKRYIESPEYKNLVDVAKKKIQKGDTLTPEEEASLKGDPKIWSEVGSTLKEMVRHPFDNLMIPLIKDYPTMVLTGQGISEFMRVAKGVKYAEAVKTAAAANKYAKGGLHTAGRVAEEAAQNIGGVAAVNYPQAKSMGEDYSAKQATRDVLVGGAITGAHMLGGHGAEKAMTAADVEGRGGISLSPQDEAVRQAHNALALVQAREQAIKAGLSPEDVEQFLASHKHDIERMAGGKQVHFTAETLPGDEPPAAAVDPVADAQKHYEDLANGKAVPEEVLKTYPHLQAFKEFQDILHSKDGKPRDPENPVYSPQETKQMDEAYARYLDLKSKNSSMSNRQPSTASTASGGGTTPGTPETMSNDPSARVTTWTGNDPTRQNVEGAEANTQSGHNSAMAENVTPATPEVKRARAAIEDIQRGRLGLSNEDFEFELSHLEGLHKRGKYNAQAWSTSPLGERTLKGQTEFASREPGRQLKHLRDAWEEKKAQSAAAPEVKPRVWTDKTTATTRPDKIPTLRQKVYSVLQKRKLYVDEELRRQLGTSKGGARELGAILTNDKASGLTLDGVAEIIREQANNANEHYEGIGHGGDVQANDVADALFSGNQVYKKAGDKNPEHVAGVDDFLRNGSDLYEGATPQPARSLASEFEAGDMMFKRVGTSDKNRIVYKDEHGGKYEFGPDEMVYTGGKAKPSEAPKEKAPATTPEENDILFQKDTPKTSQEDMFGNKGRTASEGLIKGKGEDKGLEGTPLFEGEKRAEKAKAEEDQQRMFDPEDPLNRDNNAHVRPEEEARPQEVDEGGEPNIESPARVHVSSNLRRVAREVQEGRITPDEARQQIESLASRLDDNRNTREVIREMHGRARGQDFIREKLLHARRHGHMSEEAYQLTNWFVEQNPHLVDDLGISIRSSDMPGAAGHYEPFERVVTLMKGSQNTTTGVHEILHHTERMMPTDVRSGILKAYTKQFAKEFVGADFKKLKALELISRAVGGDVRARNEVMKQFQEQKIPRSMYHLSNPSEYWAVNGARILADRHSAEGWVGRARQWLKEFIQHAKGVMGLKNDSAIIRGLRGVIQSEGRYLRTESLTERRGPQLMDVKAKEPLYQEEDKPKGSYHFDKALDKHVITLFTGRADLSTLFHEYFHYLEQGGLINAKDRAILARALKVAGYENPQETDGRFSKDAAEKLARWYERYLRNGDVKMDGMEETFGKIADKMREIYPSVNSGPLKAQIPDHIRELFDRVQNREGEATGLKGEARLHQGGEERLKLDEEFNKTTPDEDVPLEPGISRNAIPGDPASGFLTKPEAFYTAYINRGLPVEKVQEYFQKAFGLDKLKPDDDLKLRMMRVFGAGASAELHIEKNLKPIYKGLSGEEGRMVDRYALARDAIWRYEKENGFDFTPSFSLKAVNTEMRKFRALEESNPEMAKKIKTAADALVEYGKDLAVRKMRAGIWSEEQFKEWTKNPYYIPEIRDWSKVRESPLGVVKKRQFTSTDNLARGTHATSLDAPVFDPLTALIHDTRQLSTEAAKVMVWKKLIEMVDQTPELQGWIKKMKVGDEAEVNQGKVSVLGNVTTHLDNSQRKLADQYQNALLTLDRAKNDRRNAEDEYSRNLDRRKIMERVKKLPPGRRGMFPKDIADVIADVEKGRKKYMEKKVRDANKTVDEFRKLPEKDQHLIEDYLDEGKPVTYIVPKELSDAVNGMDPISMTGYRKTMLHFASFFRKAAVSWNPAFTASNVARDLQEAYFNTGMNPIWALKNLMHAVKKDDVYEAYIKAGGGMSGDESGMRQSTATADKIRYPGRYDKLKDKGAKMVAFGKEMDMNGLNRLAYRISQAAKAPFEFFEAVGEAGELMTRLGVFDYGQKKLGLSPKEAVHLARQSTIDFNRIGAKMQNANALIPFLNARIQGMDRIIRTGKGDPAAAAIRLFAAAGIPTIMLTAWNMQNPNYSDIPTWEKEYYWIVMKNKTGTGYIKVAKGSLAQFVTNPMQMIWETNVGTAKYSPKSMAFSLMKAGLPIDDPAGVLSPLEKTAIEEMTNQNFYFDQTIVKDKARNAEDQWDGRTSDALKELGHVVKLSPERMQHVIQSLAGGTGTNALYVADAITGLVKGLKKGNVSGEVSRALTGKSIPVWSKFYSTTADWKSDFASQQRELMKEIEDTKKSIMGKGEFISGSLRGVPSDTADVSGRVDRSGKKLEELAGKLDKVSRAIMAVDSLNKAIEDNIPGLKRHLMRPPTLPPKAVKLPAPPVPSDANLEASPSPAASTPAQTSETEWEGDF